MKKLYFAATAAICACVALAGCGAATTIQTPAQIASQVCPQAQAAITGLQGLSGLSATAQADLTAAAPMVTTVCAAGATVNTTDLKALAATGLPAILTVIEASPLSQQDKTTISVGVTVAEVVLAQVIASLPTATAAVPTSGAIAK